MKSFSEFKCLDEPGPLCAFVLLHAGGRGSSTSWFAWEDGGSESPLSEQQIRLKAKIINNKNLKRIVFYSLELCMYVALFESNSVHIRILALNNAVLYKHSHQK